MKHARRHSTMSTGLRCCSEMPNGCMTVVLLIAILEGVSLPKPQLLAGPPLTLHTFQVCWQTLRKTNSSCEKLTRPVPRMCHQKVTSGLPKLAKWAVRLLSMATLSSFPRGFEPLCVAVWPMVEGRYSSWHLTTYLLMVIWWDLVLIFYVS